MQSWILYTCFWTSQLVTHYFRFEALKRYAGQAIVQFAQDMRDKRAFAIKFFLDEDSFYTEAALYVAVFPHLKKWLSKRATDVLAKMTERPGVEEDGKSEVTQTMQAAASRFLPQVLLGPYLNNSGYLTYATTDEVAICIGQHDKPVLHDPVLTSSRRDLPSGCQKRAAGRGTARWCDGGTGGP
jgi:hypothetical protein